MTDSLDSCSTDDPLVKARVALSVGHSLVSASLEKAFKAEDLPGLSWFDVLNKVHLSGDEGMRSVDLQAKLLVPQYSLSRLLSKIQDAGLIEKMDCTDDARCHEVKLTKSGQAMRTKMAPIYSQALKSALKANFSAGQLSQLVAFYDAFQCPIVES